MSSDGDSKPPKAPRKRGSKAAKAPNAGRPDEAPAADGAETEGPTPPAENGENPAGDDTAPHRHTWKRIVDTNGEPVNNQFHTHRCRCGAQVRIG